MLDKYSRKMADMQSGFILFEVFLLFHRTEVAFALRAFRLVNSPSPRINYAANDSRRGRSTTHPKPDRI